MDKSLHQDSLQAETMLDQVGASNPTDRQDGNLAAAEDEAHDYDFQDFKTPLPPSPGHKSRLAQVQSSCDSGFGSIPRGALSNRSLSVGSSAQSSPESSITLKSRRITLGSCKFSPVTRESFSVIRSRKLDFHSEDALPGSSQLQFVEEDVKSQECLNEDFERQEESLSVAGGNNSLSPVSPGLFTFENDTSSAPRRSVSPDDLELSLQDMSLEESSSSSSSRPGSTSPSQHLALKYTVSQPQTETTLISSSSPTPDPPPVSTDVLDWVHENLKKLNTQVNTDLPSSFHKQNFMCALDLTSSSSVTSDLLTSVAPVSAFTSSTSQVSETVCSSHSQSIHHSTLQHQPQVFHPEIFVKNHVNDGNFLILPSATPASKSISKRTGLEDKTGYDDYLLSPTKLRKMEGCLQQKSPVQSAVGNIFDGASNHVLGSSAKDLKSMKSLSVCKCAEKAHCVAKSQGEPRQNLPTRCLCMPRKFQRLLQMSMPSAPSKLIGRNIGVAKFDIVGSLHQSFHLCVAKIYSFLQAEDLVSVFKVSRAWRRALEMDSFSFHKYQYHSHELARRRRVLACSGKENAMEKDLDTPKFKPMTESRGCFSSLQVQATPKAVEHTPLKPTSKSDNKPVVQWGDELRHCPSCQHPALVRPHQGRAVCMKESCGFDFCTHCFAAYHHPKPCKPLNRSVSKKDVAGSLKSKKSLKRL